METRQDTRRSLPVSLPLRASSREINEIKETDEPSREFFDSCSFVVTLSRNAEAPAQMEFKH